MLCTITTHAATRMQQRAIPEAAIEMLLDYGTTKRAKGADRFFFDRAARQRLQRDLSEQAVRKIARFLDAYALVSDDGAIITAAWRTGRFLNV